MSFQPYQQAGEEIKRQNRVAGDLVKGAATVALGGAKYVVATAIGGKILSFLNKYIPTDMAIKGISKVSKETGKFIKSSIAQGHPAEEVLDFVKEKISPKEEKRQETLKGFNQKIKNPGLAQQETQRFQQQYGQQGQTQQGNPQARDQLLQAMQQLTQTLKG